MKTPEKSNLNGKSVNLPKVLIKVIIIPPFGMRIFTISILRCFLQRKGKQNYSNHFTQNGIMCNASERKTCTSASEVYIGKMTLLRNDGPPSSMQLGAWQAWNSSWWSLNMLFNSSAICTSQLCIKTTSQIFEAGGIKLMHVFPSKHSQQEPDMFTY